ncbi:MAG TPA: S8 family serine peptidase [Chitinophagaceae bacterium]|nr:S8 family serine peptidase [Chitinophagaceae bacterium]
MTCKLPYILSRFCYTFLALSSTFLISAPAAIGQQKTLVTRPDQLPAQVYNIKDSMATLLQNATAIDQLRTALVQRIQQDVAQYDIRDTSLLKSYYTDLADMSFYGGNYKAALAYYDTLRLLEVKPAARLTSGLIKRSQMMAGNPASTNYLQDFRTALIKNIAGINYTVAESSLQRLRQRYKNVTAQQILQVAKTDLQPAFNRGHFSRDDLGYLLFLAYEMPGYDKLGAVVTQVMDSVSAANAHAVVSIWPQRNIVLEKNKPYAKVVLCVYDLGTDTSVFADRLYTNPKEKPDGIDNDKNGFVDDLHGVAFDLHDNKTTGLLMPLTKEQKQLYPIMTKLARGYADDQAGNNTQEAAIFKRAMESAAPSGKDSIWQFIDFVNDYAHGTHVAGIAMEGNPFAQLYTVRFSEDVGFSNDGIAPSVEQETKVAANLKELVACWKKAGVRIVSMSWGCFVSDYEKALARATPSLSEADRRSKAVQLWTMRKNALYDAFTLAPEILFIASNGNKNSNADIDQRYPAALDLPNMLGVGSVDAAGMETSFTATGKKVRIHANGYLVESYIPGGARMLMSGTSMATPYIANLAGKLLAMRPALSPVQVINLIINGADSSADGRIKLANPKKSVALLEAMQ